MTLNELEVGEERRLKDDISVIELAEKFEEQEEYEKAYDEYKKLLNSRPKSVELLPLR